MAAKNAVKNSSAKRSGKVPCGICQAPIVDGKDEALLCEGECGLWLHRGCASIPPNRYESLSASDEPFVCLCCSNLQLKKDLVLLRTEFQAALDSPPTNGAQRQQISDLTDTVAALRMEITQLKETLSSMSSELTSLRSSRPPIDKTTYASKASTRRVARSGSAHHPNTTQRQTRGRGDHNQLNVRGAAVTPASGDTASQRLPKPPQRTTPRENSRKSEKKIIVEGARRIWGTMKACPSSVILSTIAKVTEIKDELRIKKKTRNLPGNKLIWWFVIHCDEETLCLLDTEWEKVHAQTGWSLQCCYMPSINQPNSDTTDPQNPLSTTAIPSPISLSPKPNIQNTTVSESDQVTIQEHMSDTAINAGLQQPPQQP